jgi:hypothetical protein
MERPHVYTRSVAYCIDEEAAAASIIIVRVLV